LQQDLTSPAPKLPARQGLRSWRRRLGRRAALALEFAIVGPVFFLLLFVVFEVAYDLFEQEVLDNALQASARQVQIGNTTAATSGNFVSTYLCPYSGGLLVCNNVFVRMEVVNFTTTNGCTDFWDATRGTPPVSGGNLQLGLYFSGAGAAGSGGSNGVTTCDTGTGFVDPGPQQCVVMSAVYVMPSFLNGLVLNRIKYNGRLVRVAYSTAAFVTEDFPSSSAYTECS
jgi:hypothetical protein